jgi:MFS family permease
MFCVSAGKLCDAIDCRLKSRVICLIMYALLSGLMFLQLFISGSYLPLLSLYLTRFLELSGNQAALIMSVSRLTLLVSPILAARMVPRRFSERRALLILYAGITVLMLVTSVQRTFPGMFIAFFVLNFFTGPMVGLLDAVTFKHLADSRDYGKVRVWGTVGWMAAGWANGLAVRYIPGVVDALSPMFTLAAGASILFFVFATLLPGGNRTGNANTDGRVENEPGTEPPRAGGSTLRLISSPALRLILFIYFAAAVIERFYTFGSGPHLDALGLDESLLMPVLSLGQLTEIFMLIILQPVLRRFEFRTTIIVGATAAFGPLHATEPRRPDSFACRGGQRYRSEPSRADIRIPVHRHNGLRRSAERR